MTPFYNAVISSTRNGAAVLSNRRVQLDTPTRAERAEAAGTQLPAQIYDVPGADYQPGDQVTIVALDGQGATLPHPHTFTVGTVDYLPAPLALTSVELGVQYNPQPG